jgi:hypothetical protein
MVSKRLRETLPVALPIVQFARVFNIAPSTVYRHLKSGALKYRKIGPRTYVEVPEVQVAIAAE